MADTLPAKTDDSPSLGRIIGAGVIVLFVILFATFNFGRVEVDWVLFERDSRLIYVIIASALLGALASRLLQRRSSKKD
jgi:uncharacterized integral membrane protein